MKTGVVVEEEETTNEENNDQGDNVQENNEIQEVKALVVSLMETVKTLASGVDALRKELSKEDGNSNNEDDLKHKEWLQSVNRYTADKLRDYKASKSSK
ncbi:MAG: hypothetical protein EKK61_04180 [Rickettsiales bacterium]|nr:MAG: hypothetical protein EKK61_04180 [Rickettsiales bacterium]